MSVARKTSTTRPKRKRVTKASKKEMVNKESVKLPTNMSDRSREKATVLRSELDMHMQRAMYRIAYVGALCFIAVGGTVAVSSMSDTLIISPNQTAQLLQSTSNIQSTQEMEQLSSEPVFAAGGEIPDYITEVFEFTFEVSGITGTPIVSLTKREGGNIQIPVNKLGSNSYSVVLTESLIKTMYGQYRKIGVIAQTENLEWLTVFSGNYFFVGTKDEEAALLEVSAEQEEISTQTSTQSTRTDDMDDDYNTNSEQINVDDTTSSGESDTPKTANNPDPKILSDITKEIYESSSVASSSLSLDKQIDKEVKDIINNSPDLIDLQKKILLAEANGDIDLANDLQGQYERALNDAYGGSNSVDIMSALDEAIRTEVKDITEKIIKFESLRSQREQNPNLQDTDGDSISDVDERILYGTDPESADTDGDGVSDGDEIQKGSNPKDVAKEAVIVYESPKESTGLEQPDALEVEAVASVETEEVLSGEGEVKKRVKTEFRGRALPNSIVTLYIFSTPTVVTVKTNEAGYFVYTLEKELDDGQHDVYVAVTDIEGEIVAQSNPLSFLVREAQAYSGEELINADPKDEAAFADSKRDYSMTLGVTVLAFGLILLMLGVSLRPRTSSIEADENNDEGLGNKIEHNNAT